MTAKTTTTNFSFTCKYYLPCGKCDKTGGLCSHYTPAPNPTYPYSPWWEYYPTWTDKDYTITYTTNTEEVK